MSTVKSKKLQVGTDATSSNNFTIYQPATPDGTLRIGVGNADSPTEVGRFNNNGYVATNAPAFSAYMSGDQSISTSTWTKVQFNSELFDTDNCFDSTTNYRFTPTVAGYYQINFRSRTIGTSSTATYYSIYKNGSATGINSAALATNAGFQSMQTVSGIIYCNGSTDYIEFYANNNGTSPFIDAAGGSDLGNTTTVDGVLVRAA